MADTITLVEPDPRPKPLSGHGIGALWAAVVRQALDDLDYEPFDSFPYLDAAAFFLNGGEWAVARGAIADLLGVHPDDIRRCGMRHLTDRRLTEAIPEPAPAPCVPRPPPEPKTRPGRGKVRVFRFDPYRQLPSEGY